jgi:aldehyde dehydrogenase (NAD+)
MKQLLIGGAWVAPQDGESLPVIAPATGETFDHIARGKKADIDRAVKAARTALDGDWGKTSALERGRILMRLGQKVIDNAEELAQLEALDTGKPMATARNDIQVLARYLEFYGSAADKMHGEVIPFNTGYNALP